MHLKILLPSEVFADQTEVLRIVAETSVGSVGILPRRLDCAAVLTPGILIYQTAAQGDVYVAVDAGVLVKTGKQVSVSVRRAFVGDSLEQLRDVVEQEFLSMDDQEQDVRQVMAKLEVGFLHRLAVLQYE